MNTQNGNRPNVTIHYAQSLDGRIATLNGDSQWVSSNASLQLAHRLRASHEAVMVGIGTVIADNPCLTVRLADGPSPARIVVDSTLRLPLGARVLSDGASRTIIACTACAPEERIRAVRELGASVLVAGSDTSGQVDLTELMHSLRGLGIASVLIEGGQGLITSALRKRIVDRLVVCIAPKIIGAGIDAVGDLNISYLREAMTFRSASFVPLGQDLIFDGQLEPA